MKAVRSRLSPVAALLLAALLASCAPGMSGHTPATTGEDPVAPLRERTEAEYQAGLAHERADNWRAALRNYEQAQLWDPDGRPELRASVAHARAMVATLDPAAPAPTPTFRPGARPGGGLAPTGNADIRNLGLAPVPTRVAPAVGYRAFRSAIRPYVIAYPVGWEAEEWIAGEDAGQGDRFAGSLAGRGTASVTVVGITLPGETDGESVISHEVATLRGAPGFREMPPRSVGGMAATVVSYADTGEGYVVVRALCAGDGVNWQITLSARQDDLSLALVVFDAMLASFALAGAR